MKVLRLGELLLAEGVVTSADVENALAMQSEHGGLLGEILVRLGAISVDALYAKLSQQLGCPLLERKQLDVAEIQLALNRMKLPATWWLGRRVFLWLSMDGLCVASANPLDIDAREALAQEQNGQDARWYLLLPSDAEALAHQLSDVSREASSTLFDVKALRELAEDAPVVAYVNNVLAQALEARASDVHLEPGEREFTLRYRIDGVLQSRSTLPMERYPAIASRIKLIGGLDIAERRLPQDGRISTRVAGKEMDVRISSVPAVHGESLVLRLLPKERGDIGLQRTGMDADHHRTFLDWLKWPNGLILVTGPTGSGKSTTLYSALAEINDGIRKIITVEDPVELRLPGVVQIQTQSEIGYSFSRALRSILRHDPDVIMIGEIRDRETAEIAIQAALTGHLVLATLHTNDALSAVNRLVDMGIEPYMVAAALRAVMAQRLVRKVCARCATLSVGVDLLDQKLGDVLQRLRINGDVQNMPRWMSANGCVDCSGTGFMGRIGIYELVTISADLQTQIVQGTSTEQIVATARRSGCRSLAEDGLLKSARGLTTWEEVMRSVSA